jgi:hypothetical protein
MQFNTIKIRYNDGTFKTEYNNVESKLKAVSEVLEIVFANWNNGSGSECPEFLASKVRSLSVGDYVAVDGQWHRCEGIGWSEVSKDDVAKWFFTLSEVRSKRSSGATEEEEIMARWRDRRRTEELLGIFS